MKESPNKSSSGSEISKEARALRNLVHAVDVGTGSQVAEALDEARLVLSSPFMRLCGIPEGGEPESDALESKSEEEKI